MAYVPDLKEKREEEQASGTGGLSSAVGSQGRSGGGGVARQAKPHQASTPFFNLSGFLKANRQGAQRAAGAIGGRIEGIGAPAEQSIAKQQENFDAGVQKGTVQGGTVRQEGPTAGAQSQTKPFELTQGNYTQSQEQKAATSGPPSWAYTAPQGAVGVSEAEQLAKQTYTGPQSLSSADPEGFQKAATDAQQAASRANLTATMGGRESLAQDQFRGYMSPFQRALTGYTTGQVGAGQFNELRSRFGGLYDLISNKNKASEATATAASELSSRNAAGFQSQADAEKARQAARWKELGFTANDFRQRAGNNVFSMPYEDWAADRAKRGLPVASRAEWQAAKAAFDKFESDLATDARAPTAKDGAAKKAYDELLTGWSFGG